MQLKHPHGHLQLLLGDLFPIFPILLVELLLKLHVSFLVHVFLGIDNVMIVADEQLVMLNRELLMKFAMTKHLGNLFRSEIITEESGNNYLLSIFSNGPNKLYWIRPDSLMDWIRLANKNVAFIHTEEIGHSRKIFLIVRYYISYQDVKYRSYQSLSYLSQSLFLIRINFGSKVKK